MRVLTINTTYSTGGAANVALTLHKYMMRQNGIYPVFLSGRGDMVPTDNIITLHHNQLYEYANAIAYRVVANDGIFSKWTFAHILRELLPYIDIIHIHNMHGYYMHDSVLNIIEDMPVVWTLHDFWIATGRCTFPLDCKEWMNCCTHCSYISTRYPRTWVVRNFNKAYAFKRSLFKKFKQLTLVVPSQSFRSHLYNFNIKCLNMEIIYNGIDINIFKPTKNIQEKQNIMHKLSLPDDTLPIMCFMARRVYEPRKNFAILHRSLHDLGREVRLLIIGESNHCLDRMQFGRNIHVMHRGYIKDRNVLTDYLRVADVVVNPSEDETFGLTSLEALSCGARPVVFRIPIFQEVLGKWAVFAQERSSESLRESILHSLENTLSFDEKQNAYEYVRSGFSLERMCDSYIGLYRQAIDKSRPGRT